MVSGSQRDVSANTGLPCHCSGDDMAGAWQRIYATIGRRSGGITGTTFIPKNGPDFQIKSSKDKPDHSLVAINTRDYWYYIDDRDILSKNMFGFVQILMSLTADGQSGVSPLISIGN